jgi:hypothetical protein
MRAQIKKALAKATNEHGEVDYRTALIELDKKGLNVAAGQGGIQTIWHEELRLARGL